MAIKQVTVYRTEDGKEFSDRPLAELHEIKMQAFADLEEILRPAVTTGRVEAVILSMLGTDGVNESVRAVLSKYAQRTRRRKKTLAMAE